MNSKGERYSGYQGYNESTFKPENSKCPNFADNTEIEKIPLPEPVMNVKSLIKLANYLDTNKSDHSFPEITFIPDLLRNVGRFVNERKRMKYKHQEFISKIEFLSQGVDKQYKVAMEKLGRETEVQLAQINSNSEQRILEINRYYDTEVKKVMAEYQLKSQEINMYYHNLEAQRREQNKRFNKLVKIAQVDARKANAALKEAEQVCCFLREKIYNNTATSDDREQYMELLKIRMMRINTVDIIAQLAAKIE